MVLLEIGKWGINRGLCLYVCGVGLLYLAPLLFVSTDPGEAHGGRVQSHPLGRTVERRKTRYKETIHLKKLASLFLALTLCASLTVPALAAEFSDVSADHPFRDAIADCAEKGIVGGYSDGTFKPTDSVTRAQFCVMLSRAFYAGDIQKYDTNEYRRIWFGPSTKALSMAGVLKGTGFSYAFGEASIMNQKISRYDMAQLMANIMKDYDFTADASQKSVAQGQIADYSTIPEQYKDAVATVYALGMITGYANGTFGGDGIMNRGQAAVVIYRLAQSLGEGSGTGPETSVDDDLTNVPENPAGPGSSTPLPVAPDTSKPETPGLSDFTLANGKTITEENVLAIIQELLKEYPAGMTWNGSTARPGTASTALNKISQAYAAVPTGMHTNMQIACGGFASLVSDRIFGSGDANPARKVPVEQVRPGDVIIMLNAEGKLTHVAIAASRITGIDTYTNFPVLTIYDGNVEGKVCYKNDYPVPQNYSTCDGYYVEVWTRYPSNNTTPWTGSGTGSDAGSDFGPVGTDTGPGSAHAAWSANKTCDLCGGTTGPWTLSSDRSRHMCNNCYRANPSAVNAYIAG